MPGRATDSVSSHVGPSVVTDGVAVPASAEPFEVFYERSYARAVRLAVLVARDDTPAEDLVQEVFASMFGRYGTLRNPDAYLAGAVVKRVRGWQRRQSVRNGARRSDGRPQDHEDRIVDHLLLRAIKQLPLRQRAVVVLRYWGQWSEAEIAKALGCRPGTVKSLASRALARLRTEMDPDGI